MRSIKLYLGLSLMPVLLVIGMVAIRHKAIAALDDHPLRASQTQMLLDLANAQGTLTPTSPVVQSADSATAETYSRVAATHSFGGSTWTVTGAGNRLYYNAGADLVIADITNPDAPSILGRWMDSDKAGFGNTHVAGSLIYIPHRFAGVEIVDVSNASHPVQVGNIPLLYIGGSANAISSIVVSGTRAYAVQGKLFRVVDVAVPDSSVSLAVITPTLGYLRSLVISDKYAYVAAGSNGLGIIDISTPTTPTIINILDTPGYASGVAKQGSYVYISDHDAIRIVDVSNPNAPIEIGVYQPSNFYPGENMAVSGGLLYVQDQYGDELHIVDIDNPNTPTAAGILSLPSSGFGLYLSGSTAYLGTSRDGLAVVDVSDPGSPSLLNTVGEMSYASSVAAADNAAFVLSKQDLWYIRPQVSSVVATPVWNTSLYLGAVAVNNGFAYVTKDDDMYGTGYLEALDIGNPYSLISRGIAPLTIQGADLVVISGTYAYVGSWSGVSTVNVANPAAPYETSWAFVPSGVNVRGLDIEGNYLYAATTGGLKIYDVSDPATLAFVGEYASSASDVAVEGRYAYVPVDSMQAVQVIDVLNPTAPVLVKTLNACGSSGAVAVSGGYLYLANGCQGIQLYDVRDPLTAPNYSISYVELPSYGKDVVAVGRKILVADGSGGFVQLQRLEGVSDYIPTSGGALTSPDGAVTTTVPADTYTNTVYLRYEEKPGMGTGSLNSAGLFFALTAYYTSTWELAPLSPDQSITVSVDYLPSIVREDTLQLYRFDGAAWTSSGISSTVDTDSGQVIAQLTTFSGDETFALLGESYSVYLPSVLKKSGR